MAGTGAHERDAAHHGSGGPRMDRMNGARWILLHDMSAASHVPSRDVHPGARIGAIPTYCGGDAFTIP